MSYHNDQPVSCHLPQQIHYLYACIAVQSAGGLIRQQDIRIIDQSAGNRHSLHLSSGHLVRLFMNLIAKPHLIERLFRPSAPLGLSDSGYGQSQFHIGQNCLMRNQVVTLKYEAYGMIPVGIPVPVFIFLCGNPVDDQISAVIPVQPPDNIKKRGLS